MGKPQTTENAIGVIGGMGPEATGYFYDLLVRRTDGDRDQDYLRIVVDSNPTIPDRTGYLIDDGPDPRPRLVETGRNVVNAGAVLLTMPCNTAHAFYDDVVDAVDVPVLHMIRLTAEEVVATTDVDRVGLLATDGTISLRLYHDYFDGRPVELVSPPPEVQERVMTALYDIKAGHVEGPRRRLAEAVDAFDGVDAVIAGCTEVPLALRPEDVPVPLVDPMTVLADQAIARARADVLVSVGAERPPRPPEA